MWIMRRTRCSLGIIPIAMMIVGCSPSDERLVQFSQQSIQTQHEQNDALARQSEAVVRESHSLATAAGQLVDQDAEARQEIILAQSKLHEQLHQERSGVDRQREQLDDERRGIAFERQRDPIIGAAIENVGLLLACLTPLVLAAYALRQLRLANHEPPDLGELLLAEFTVAPSGLLPRSEMPLLPQTHRTGTHIADRTAK